MFQVSQRGDLADIIGQMISNGQPNQQQNIATQALAQRFQPNMGDVGQSSIDTARSFLSPNFKPSTPEMAAQTRVQHELEPYTTMLGLQKNIRDINAPYSDYGKINADLTAGRITPEMAQQALSKTDLDTQLKQAQIAALTTKATNSMNNTPIARALAQKDAGTLTSYTDAGNAANALVDNARQFQEFRKQANFGGPIGGLLPSFSDAAQNADSINATMATNITSMMKGSQSDRELSMALRSVPSLRMGQGAVAEAVKKYEAAAAVTQTKQTFMDQYVQAHGDLRGAEQLWQQFRQQNPIMDNRGQLRTDIGNIYNPVQDFSSIIGGGAQNTDLDENSILQELQRRGVQ